MSIGGKRSAESREALPTGTEATNGTWEQSPVNPQNPLDGIIQNKPVVTQVQQRRSVIDSEYVPLTHIIIHSSGDLWKVDYYRQLVGLDDKLKPLQAGMSAVEQPYELITGLQLRVDDPLVPTQDQETKEFDVVGTGSITNGVIPNQGDMFVADIGGGVAGLLTVTSSEKAAYTKDAAYMIRWKVVEELSIESERLLEERTIRTLVYVPELTELYDTPFMTEAAFETYVGLQDRDHQLIEMFKDRFWSREVRSIRVPGNSCKVYDGFHAEFCRSLGLTDVSRPIQTYALGSIDNNDVRTLWDLFEDMDTFRMNTVHRDFTITPTKALPGVHVTRSIAWSQYEYAIVPDGVIDEIDGEVEFLEASYDVTLGGIPAVKSLPIIMSTRFNIPRKPLFGQVTFIPYVFSQQFYANGDDVSSILEMMTLRMLRGEVVPPEIVSILATELFTESTISIYYYTPIILVLIHYCKRGGM